MFTTEFFLGALSVMALEFLALLALLIYLGVKSR